MKNRRRVLIFLVCMVFVFTGCIKRSVMLSLDLKKGNLYKVEIDRKNKITENINNEKVEVECKIKTAYLCNVVNRDDNKNSEIKVTIDSININHSENKGQKNVEIYNNVTENWNKLLEIYSVFVGKSFKVKIGQYGKVKAIIGIEDLMKNVLKELNIKDEKEREEVKNAINTEFGDKAILKRIERVTAVYPNKKVKVGDTWKKKTSASDKFPVESENSYKLKESEDGTSEIEVQSNIKINNNVEPIIKDGMKIIYEDINGSEKGVTNINEDTGFIKSTESESKYSGNIKILSEDASKGTQIVPINIYEKYIINVLSQ